MWLGSVIAPKSGAELSRSSDLPHCIVKVAAQPEVWRRQHIASSINLQQCQLPNGHVLPAIEQWRTLHCQCNGIYHDS
jgi:hypothetical protein